MFTEPLEYINVRQPFFAAMSDQYKKIVVNRYGIVHFYQFKTSSEIIKVIPDGCVDMVFCCSEKPYAYVHGSLLKAGEDSFDTNTIHFGVRFLPGFNPILGENVMDKMLNTKIPFGDLINDEKMLHNIFTADSFKGQTDAFMQSYMSIYRRIHPMDKSNLIVRHAMNMIFRSRRNITVEAIADETGYTTRHINQCFRDEAALSPKKFINIIRFQSALNKMHTIEKISLSAIASTFGYFDQTHFIKEFKEFTGFTPKMYKVFLKESSYSTKIYTSDYIFPAKELNDLMTDNIID